MRIEPKERPGLMIRLFYRISKKVFGKVITPAKVIYSHKPAIMYFVIHLNKVESGIKLETELKRLSHYLVSSINGCDFCMDISMKMTPGYRQHAQKFRDILQYQESPLFTHREKAALRYMEETTRYRKVSDDTFEKLKRYFNDKEIVELTWLCATHNYYNLMNVPLGIESDGLCAL